MKQCGIRKSLWATAITMISLCASLFGGESATSPTVIIFNTLPKSGSVFIAQTVSQGLKIPLIKIAHGTFPHDTIIPSKLNYLCQYGGIAQEHFDVSPHNIDLLKRHNMKLIVHFRDPRQALLSWTHHLCRLLQDKKHHGTLMRSDPVPPKAFLTYPLTKKLDWAIEHYFPSYIEWMANWLIAYKKNLLPMKITTYETFHDTPAAFFKNLLSFYEIPDTLLVMPSISKTITYNFRKGSKDEWIGVFTEKQKEKMSQMIPEEFFEEFDWIR